MIGPSQGRYLQRATQRNGDRHSCLKWARDPRWGRPVDASDRAATVASRRSDMNSDATRYHFSVYVWLDWGLSPENSGKTAVQGCHGTPYWNRESNKKEKTGHEVKKESETHSSEQDLQHTRPRHTFQQGVHTQRQTDRQTGPSREHATFPWILNKNILRTHPFTKPDSNSEPCQGV